MQWEQQHERRGPLFVGELGASEPNDGVTMHEVKNRAAYASEAMFDIFGDGTPGFLSMYDQAVWSGYRANDSKGSLVLVAAVIIGTLRTDFNEHYGIGDWETTSYLIQLAGDYRAGENFLKPDQRIKTETP